MVKIVKTKGEQGAPGELDGVYGRTIYLENLSLITSIIVEGDKGSDNYLLGPSTATFKSSIEFENWDLDTIKIKPQSGSTIYYCIIVKDNPIFLVLEELKSIFEDLRTLGIRVRK